MVGYLVDAGGRAGPVCLLHAGIVRRGVPAAAATELVDVNAHPANTAAHVDTVTVAEHLTSRRALGHAVKAGQDRT